MHTVPIKYINISNNFEPYKYKKLALKEQNIETDNINLLDENLNIGNCVKNMLSKRTLQNGLLKNRLSSFLKELKFSNQKFSTSISISNIKYNYLKL